ncbi:MULTISPECIES: hypothetical protein [Aerococcus]|uniref:hypothetical protein n=1 Tax=Aerococcus TaxID=1375 RepID=UPI000DCD88FA|nr:MULTISPECIES: hypothetical protein [Aerococcus]KAA9232824.1 hypothetical protein F6I37_07100 [Aerococcus mictus]MDK6292537.1 hypothetical protein [Aerococcus urinae]MDK6374782.1 hypothetical protein [Aerococcus urinae]MDK6420193.1 hypothetical protein [Aerococcus urinae]MDK8074657.1 hypothetical protein [Aerococcus urinae]
MSENITYQHVDEFKSIYVKSEGLGIETDDELKQLLENAYSLVVSYSKDFEMDTHPTGRMLVYDAARYIRANASELFFQNFKPDLNAFGFNLLVEDREEKLHATQERRQ